MNIYGSPERFGLKMIGEVDRDESYQFDMVVVWQNVEDGRLFYGSDAGCSCPTPFEDQDFLDLIPLHERTLADFKQAMQNTDAPLNDRDALLRKVEKALK